MFIEAERRSIGANLRMTEPDPIAQMPSPLVKQTRRGMPPEAHISLGAVCVRPLRSGHRKRWFCIGLDRVAVGLVLTLLALSLRAQAQLPQEVSRFIDRRDTCDHFRGEEPYDAERRAFIEKSLKRFCRGTDRRLAALRLKYEANAAVMEKLRTYESKVESPNHRATVLKTASRP